MTAETAAGSTDVTGEEDDLKISEPSVELVDEDPAQ